MEIEDVILICAYHLSKHRKMFQEYCFGRVNENIFLRVVTFW